MTEKQKSQLRRKWKRWIETLRVELANLLISADIFEEVRRLANANRQIQTPFLFCNWMIKNYGDTITLRIRALGDHDRRSISLHRLIEDISENREAISRALYTSRYPRWMRDRGLADRDFDNFANKGSNLMSLYKLTKDMRRVEKATKRIRDFVNRWVAHCDLQRRRVRPVMYKEVDKALSNVDQLFCKYYMLLTRSGMATAKPVVGYDWREPLRHAWIVDDEQRQ